ncbi:hypothetical protein MTP99_018750 [Tenebrio molitor]|nr:hypothetical protein MTP99_018750 [Tenebrio molitor]
MKSKVGIETCGLLKSAGETLYDCNKIDYFSKEAYSPDPSDSTMAIPYTVTRSVFFFLAASLLLCGGYCCCMLGQCVRHRTLYTFISGVIFIVTGKSLVAQVGVHPAPIKSRRGCYSANENISRVVRTPERSTSST